MILKNAELTLLNIIKREGISKLGKPYLFYEGKFVDDEGNVCNLKIGKPIIDNPAEITKLLVLKNVEVTADVSLYPSGFLLKGTIAKITT
jgi:hypothetical protein